jgi:hypothetical protein
LKSRLFHSIFEEKEGITMSDVKDLSHDERVFLAGSIRNMILEDGTVEDTELDDLDSLFQRLHFTDYETCLEEYEAKIVDEDTFTAAAKRIRSPSAQTVILDTLYELLLRKNLPEDTHQGEFGKLNQLWKQEA